MVVFFFFFSSRRRHTRCSRDWSSDVCSSDLLGVVVILVGLVVNLGEKLGGDTRAALQRSELGMIDRNLEGIFSAKRSEEHTSELQSRLHLVCRLLLEKKKRLFP